MTYRVVGTGDSIMQLSASFVLSPDRWIDFESGRQAYTKGNQGRWSTAEMWPRLISQSRTGSWIILQDNGLGCTDDEWKCLMDHIAETMPSGRCLAAVLPWFDPAYSQAAKEVVWERNRQMVRSLQRIPCLRFVRWDQAVVANPALTYDGQHPTEAGARRLGELIDLEVGPRVL